MSHKKNRHDDGQEHPAGTGEAPTAESMPAEPAAPAAAAVQPREECDKLRAERDDLLERLKWLSADYQNYQKRIGKEMQHVREFANESLIKSLLGVLDDMDRAIAAADGEDPMLVGIKLVRDKMLQTLQGFGLSAVEVQGQPFDPQSHQAVMEQESAEHPPGMIIQQLQPGYQLKGRLIRPASVIVSKLPEAPAQGAEGQESPERED